MFTNKQAKVYADVALDLLEKWLDMNKLAFKIGEQQGFSRGFRAGLKSKAREPVTH